MPDITQPDNEIGSFTSVIELRAFMQAEITRLKEDVDKLVTVTMQHAEGNALRDERQRTVYTAVKDMRSRIVTLSDAFAKIKAVDEASVKDIVHREIELAISSLESRIKLDEATKQLREVDNPTGPFKRLSDKLDEFFDDIETRLKESKQTVDTTMAECKESSKKASDKASAVESDVKDIKTKIAIYSSIGAVIAVKLLDLAMNAFKSLGH